MTIFFLQDGIPNNPLGWQESRVFLDDKLHPKCALVDTLDAVNTDVSAWRNARSELPC